MKKAITIFIVAVLAFALACVQATLTYRDIKVLMNGEQLDLVDSSGNSVEPFIINGTTYLPLRVVATALGLEVGWDGATSTVSLCEEEQPQMNFVYITKTGSKYHMIDNCNGGTYWAAPYESAVGMGLKPCDKCCH